jgi:stage II sporulation protein D
MRRSLVPILLMFLAFGMGKRPRIEEKIRVVLLNGPSSVTISSKKPYRLDLGALDPLSVASGKTRVEAKEGKVSIPERGIEASSIRFLPSESGLLEVEGRRYRGAIEVSTAGRGLIVVNEIELEQYLYGVVGKELSPQWPKEALKAQAVASRTFALWRKLGSKGGEYLDALMAQAYGGYEAESEEVRDAVDATRGEVMVGEDGMVIPAFFHTACGGMTESSEEVFGMRSPHLIPIVCPYCSGYPGNIWFLSLTARELGDVLSKAYGGAWDPVEISPLEKTASARVRRVVIRNRDGKEIVLKATDLRKLIGYNRLRSTYFDVTKIGNEFDFVGMGFGHGVGMCQWGARRLAEEGKGYREILGFYYPGTRIILWTGGKGIGEGGSF